MNQLNKLYSFNVNLKGLDMSTLFALILHLKSVKFATNPSVVKLTKVRMEEVQSEMNERGIPKTCNTPAFKMEVQTKLRNIQDIESDEATRLREREAKLVVNHKVERKLDMSPSELRENMAGSGYKGLMLAVLEA